MRGPFCKIVASRPMLFRKWRLNTVREIIFQLFGQRAIFQRTLRLVARFCALGHRSRMVGTESCKPHPKLARHHTTKIPNLCEASECAACSSFRDESPSLTLCTVEACYLIPCLRKEWAGRCYGWHHLCNSDDDLVCWRTGFRIQVHGSSEYFSLYAPHTLGS